MIPRAIAAYGSAATFVLIATTAATGSEPLPPRLPRPVHLRVHWVPDARGLSGDGWAVRIASDSLRFERLVVRPDGADFTKEVPLASVHLPELDRIHVRGMRRHWLIGGAAGAVLGLAARPPTATPTWWPWWAACSEPGSER